MIKLTRSALTMLLAHYRAIFKHAYVKGLATAVVVGSLGLTGTAQAAAVAWDTVSTAATVGVDTTEEVDVGSAGTAGGNITVDGVGHDNTTELASEGTVHSLKISADTDVSGKDTALTVSKKGAVTVGGTLKVKNDITITGGTITFTDAKALQSTAGTFSMDAAGTVTASGKALSISGATVNITGGTISQTDATTGGDITIASTTNGLSNAATITSTKGAINLTGAVGLTNTGKITADNGAVTLIATTGDLENSTNITSTKGAVTLSAAAGNIVNSGTLFGSGDIKLKTKAGNITGGGNISGTAAAGVITISAKAADDNGVAVSVGNLTGKSVTISPVAGTVTTGDIRVYSVLNGLTGNYTGITTGSITAIGTDDKAVDVTVKTTAGTEGITTGSITGAAVTVTNKVGDININGSVSASGAVAIAASATGNVTVGSVTNTAAGNTSISAEAGNIKVDSVVDSVGTITLKTTNGGSITAGNLYTVKADGTTSDITVDANKGGNVTLTGNITGKAVKVSAEAASGDITIVGDINAIGGGVSLLAESGNISVTGAISFDDDSEIISSGTLALGALVGADAADKGLEVTVGTGNTTFGNITNVSGLALDTTKDATFSISEIGQDGGLTGAIAVGAGAPAKAVTLTVTDKLTADATPNVATAATVITLDNASVLDASAVTGSNFAVYDANSIVLNGKSTAILDGDSMLDFTSDDDGVKNVDVTGAAGTSGAYVANGIQAAAGATVILNISDTDVVDTIYLDGGDHTTGNKEVTITEVENALYAASAGNIETILKGVDVKAAAYDDFEVNQALNDAGYVNNAGEVSSNTNAAAQLAVAQDEEAATAEGYADNGTDNKTTLTKDELAGSVLLGTALVADDADDATKAAAVITNKTLNVSGAHTLTLVTPKNGNFVNTADGQAGDLAISGGTTVDLVGTGAVGNVRDNGGGAGDSVLAVNGNTVGFDAGVVTIASLGEEAVTGTEDTAAKAPAALGKIYVAEGTAVVTGKSYVRNVELGDEKDDASLLTGLSELNIGFLGNEATVSGVGTVAATVLNVGNSAQAQVKDENNVVTTAAYNASIVTVGSDVFLGSGVDADETVNLAGTVKAGDVSTIYQDSEHTYTDDNDVEHITYIKGAQVQAGKVNVVKDAVATIGTLNTEVLTTNQDSDLTVNNYAVLGDVTDGLATTSTIAGSYVYFEDVTLANGRTRLNIKSVTDSDEVVHPSFVVANTWDLSGGTVALDPSILVLDTTQNDENEAANVPVYKNTATTELNGDLIVGKGSALYVGQLGLADNAEQTAIATALNATGFDGYLTGGTVNADLSTNTLDSDTYGALAYIDGDLVIGNGDGIVVNKSLSTSTALVPNNEITVSGGYFVLDGADVIFDQDQQATFALTGTANSNAVGNGSTLETIEDSGLSTITAGNVNLGSGAIVEVNDDTDLTITAGVLNERGNGHTGSFTAASNLYLPGAADDVLTLVNFTDKTVALTGRISSTAATGTVDGADDANANNGTLILSGDGYGDFEGNVDALINLADNAAAAEYDTARKDVADFSLTALTALPADVTDGNAAGTVYGPLNVLANTVVDIGTMDLANYAGALANVGWIRANVTNAKNLAAGNLITSSLLLENEAAAANNTTTVGLTVAGGDTYVTKAISLGTVDGGGDHINNLVEVNGGDLYLANVGGTANGASFKVSNGTLGLLATEHDHSLGETYTASWTDLGDLEISGTGVFLVDKAAVAQVEDLNVKAGDVVVNDGAQLTVSGLLTTSAGTVFISGGDVVATAGSRLAKGKVILDDRAVLTLGIDNVATLTDGEWKAVTNTDKTLSQYVDGAVISNDDPLGTVALTGLDSATLTGEQIEGLFDAMFDNKYKGSLYLGDKLTISDLPTEAVKGADLSATLARTQFYESATISDVDPDTVFADEQPYHVGNVVLSSTKSLNIANGLLDLNKAADNGNYITDSAGDTASVHFTNAGYLFLDNGGALNNITSAAEGQGTVVFQDGTHTIKGSIGESGFALGSVVVEDKGVANVAGALYTEGGVTVEEGSSLTVGGSALTATKGEIEVEGTLTAASAAVTAQNVDVRVGGSLTGKSVTTTADIKVRENAALKADSVKAGAALGLLNNSKVEAGTVETTGGTVVEQSSTLTAHTATVGGALEVTDASTLTVKASGDNKGDLTVKGATVIGSETSGDGSKVEVDNLMTAGGNIQVLNASLSAKYLDLNNHELFLDPAYFYANKLVQDGDVDAENSVLEGDIVVGSGSGFFLGDDFSSESAFESYAKSLIGTTSAAGETITAVAYLDDTLEVTTGSNLIVDGAVTADNYEDYFTAAEGEYTGDANTFQVADGGYVKMTNDALYDSEGNQVAAVQFENATATVVNDGTLDLLDVDFTVGTPLTVFTANGSVDGVTVTDNGTTVAGNPLYSASFGGNGDLELTYSDALAAARLEYTDDSIADPIKAFAQTDGNFWDASSFVSKALNLGTAQETGKALNSAARFAVLGGAVQNAQVAQRAYTDAIEERMGFVAKTSSNIGEVKGTDVTVWVTPQYSYSDSEGYSAGKSGGYGMDSKLWGIALGADVAFQNGLTVGAAFHGGSGKSDKNGGGFAKTHSKFTYAGVSVYGAYQYQGFKVLGDFTFTNTRNDIDQDNPVGKIKDKFDTNLYSIGLTGKYDFTFEGGVTVTPHLGVRWSHFKVDSFTGKIDTADNFKGKSFNGDQVTFPVGVGVSKDFRTKNGWALKPAADFSVIPVAGDRDVKTKIVSNNIEMSAKSDISDAVLFRGRVGFDAQYKNFGLGIGYTYLGSKNTSSHSFSVTARYTF